MNLTGKELRRFGSVINGLLEELPKLIPHKDDKLPLNNQKYTYSYIQDVNRLYVSLFCEGSDAYYFYIELDSDSDAYVMRERLVLLYSISSKERFINLYTALCLVVQTNTFLTWKD